VEIFITVAREAQFNGPSPLPEPENLPRTAPDCDNITSVTQPQELHTSSSHDLHSPVCSVAAHQRTVWIAQLVVATAVWHAAIAAIRSCEDPRVSLSPAPTRDIDAVKAPLTSSVALHL
jgi:hypothetical protein